MLSFREFTLRPLPLAKSSIPREKMPQVLTKNREAYWRYLDDLGIRHYEANIPAKKISPIQNEFDPSKIEFLHKKGFSGHTLISKDYKILDGNHRWAAVYHENPEHAVKCIVIDVPMRKLLDITHDWEFVTYKKLED